MPVSLPFFLPFERFLRTETRAGTLLIVSTFIALGLANSGWSESWFSLWSTPIAIQAGEHRLELTALGWVNDFFMAAFFLLVGLEIKRELLVGELNSPRKAALPLVAAVGGMVVPAALYFALAGRSAPSGWGIPMATDIAFSIGLARLLGSRVPAALLVFLTAFAIADDLGAVLVIALFYGHAIAWGAVGWVVGLVGVLVAMNRFGVRLAAPYVLVGLPLWLAVHESGIHATVAGVLVGLCVPAPGGDGAAAMVRAEELIHATRGLDPAAALEAIEHHVDAAQSPLTNLEHGLHPYVAFLILPVFALANAGVDLRTLSFSALTAPVTLGIAVGLVVGKPVGVLTGGWLAVKSGVAELPTGVGWGTILGAGLLGGVGFTMSLFIASLAFAGEPALEAQAKLGILVGSGLAGGLGLAVLRRVGSKPA